MLAVAVGRAAGTEGGGGREVDPGAASLRWKKKKKELALIF